MITDTSENEYRNYEFLEKIGNAIHGSDKLKVNGNTDNGKSKDVEGSIHKSSGEDLKNE